MPILHAICQGDGAWPDLEGHSSDGSDGVTWLKGDQGDQGKIQLCRLEAGMQSGKSSVAIRIDLPDGQIVIAETSMYCFEMCAAAFKGAEQRQEELKKKANDN